MCQIFEAGVTLLGGLGGFVAGGGLGLLEIAATGGLATPVAVSTAAAGTTAGLATGKALAGTLSNIFFSSSDDGPRRKPGSLGNRKGTDALRRENAQFREAVRRLGLEDKDQIRRLKDEISGQGFSLDEIVEHGRMLFGGGGGQ